MDTPPNQSLAAQLAKEVLDELGIERRQAAKKIAFGWYGGKYSHLDWLLPHLPPAEQYCEPFGGSAAVLLNREPAPVETYNDLDGEVVNFFRVLRDSPQELSSSLILTPFARAELVAACREPNREISDLERARRFYVRARQTRSGLAQTASEGRWAQVKRSTSSRRGMSGSVSRFYGGTPGLSAVAARLARVQLENRPAIELVRMYDDPATLFYCDPPYTHDSRADSAAYGFEMSDDEHRDLSVALHAAAGRVVVSGYACPLMDELYGDWRVVCGEERTAHSSKALRRECLWFNFDAP